MFDVPESPFISESGSRMLVLSLAPKQDYLQPVPLMLDQQAVSNAGSLAIHMEMAAFEFVRVLRTVFRFLFRDKQPNGLVALGAKDAIIDRSVLDGEFLF